MKRTPSASAVAAIGFEHGRGRDRLAEDRHGIGDRRRQIAPVAPAVMDAEVDVDAADAHPDLAVDDELVRAGEPQIEPEPRDDVTVDEQRQAAAELPPRTRTG